MCALVHECANMCVVYVHGCVCTECVWEIERDSESKGEGEREILRMTDLVDDQAPKTT